VTNRSGIEKRRSPSPTSMALMDITIHWTFLPHEDPDVSLAFYRDTLGFEVRKDVGYGGMRWITVGPADQPGTSIVLEPPAADPGVTDEERRTIVEMMDEGQLRPHRPGDHRPRRYLCAGAGRRRRGCPRADRAAARGSRLRLPRSRGQPHPHQRAGLRAATPPSGKRSPRLRDLDREGADGDLLGGEVSVESGAGGVVQDDPAAQ
jgi:catechol 2,3-dioxygenase-like lactoylglutathione lyase family enzyme